MNEFAPIVSSNLASARFDDDEQAIIVRFRNGTAYKYPGCSMQLYAEFEKTFDGRGGRSAGKFLYAQLRPRPYERIEDWNEA